MTTSIINEYMMMMMMMMMMGCPYLPIHIWVSYSCRSLDDLLVLTEEQGHNEVVF